MKKVLSKLIASLSPAEKRQFILSTKKQKTPNIYVDLFKIIDKHKSYNWENIKKEFSTKHPTTSFESTSTYLNKLLLDTLIQNKIRNDETYKLLYGLLHIKILQDRNLPAAAYSEIKKNILLAAKYQELSFLYFLKRKELNYLSNINFRGIKEKDLIAKQSIAKGLLRNLKSIQEHNTLYELLKYRLNSIPNILSDQTKIKLNDLLLSEIAIINSDSKQTLESKRLHLLFQSFYFIKIGDYNSALKTFYILNDLYESKLISFQFPPVDYYSMLDGILDSLRMIDHYEEMDYFLKKLITLDRQEYPDYFRLLIKKTILITQLRIFSKEKNWTEAVNLFNTIDRNVIRQSTVISQQKQTELLFYISLTLYKSNRKNIAIKYINDIILNKNLDYSSLIYRIARMFKVVMYYENREIEYLEYEIRSYKRTFKGKTKALLLEKYIFKVIKIDPKYGSKNANQLAWEKLKPQKDAISCDKYESQILKYFDFLEWSEKYFV